MAQKMEICYYLVTREGGEIRMAKKKLKYTNLKELNAEIDVVRQLLERAVTLGDGEMYSNYDYVNRLKEEYEQLLDMREDYLK